MAEQTLDESIQHEDKLCAISFLFHSTRCFIFASTFRNEIESTLV